jgi:photosystem II stability/assembly factor-like uncharacterized protein
MKVFLTIIIILLPFLPVQAQWKKAATPTIEDLYDIQVRGAVGYSAGQNSTVLRTDDSGKSWKKLALGIACNLRALYFTDSLTGIVTGENARILKTINGGKTWVQKYVRVAAYTNAIVFSGNQGIAVGRDMLAIRSADAGETWHTDTTLNSRKMLNGICISPDGTCWAVGDSGYILNKHLSRGKWDIIKYPTTINLNSISCIGDSVLLIAGGMPDSTRVGVHYNIFLRSTDKGKTWASTAISEMKTVNAAFFRTKDTGFFAGSNGIISRSYEPFTKRNQQKSGSASMLNQIMFDGSTGFIAGDGGTILRTTNEGGYGLSLHTITNTGHLNIYPNPSKNGRFLMTYDVHVVELKIFNSQGQLILTKKTPAPSEEIQIAQQGIFTIMVTGDNGSTSSCQVIVE